MATIKVRPPTQGAIERQRALRRRMASSERVTIAFITALWLVLGFSSEAAAKLVIGQGQRLVASDPADFARFGAAVAIDGDTAVVGAPDDPQLGEQAGAVYLFVRSGSAWQAHPTPKLVSTNATDQSLFGQSVALSGTALIVGAESRTTGIGTAYVFRRATAVASSAWVQEQQLTSLSVTPFDLFGRSVAISGNLALVGAPGDTDGNGAAYVFFRRTGANPWALQDPTPAPTPACSAASAPCACTGASCKLLPSGLVEGAGFAQSLALDGNTVLVGAPGQGDAGSAFVFQQTAGFWSAASSLVASGTCAPPVVGDSFGRGVSLSGDWALIGAPGSNVNFVSDAGSAFFFQRTTSLPVWQCRQRVDTPAPADTGGFGQTVSLSGIRAAIGAEIENSERGFVHVYSREGTTWRRASPPVTSGGVEHVGFGVAVAVAADSVITSAQEEPCVLASCTERGAAYAFAISDAPAVPFLGKGAALALFVMVGAGGAGLLRRRLTEVRL